ncbi:MAG: histidine kinase [Actinobacteria bacterium]|nr:histidine kinase [Actinomycetota bacterium]MCA1720318.1 histidine kinase [Actinomycetota bacterium]
MNQRLEAALAATPLAVLLALPAAFTGLVAFAYGHTLLLVGLGVALTVALAVEIADQVRGKGVQPRAWSAEVAGNARRVKLLERRLAVLERAGVSVEPVAADRGRTFTLFTQLVYAEEATRAQIAAELHDAVAQTMAKALMELRAGRSEEACSSVQEAEEQLRAVMARMRPPELADGNLAGAIAELCNDLQRRYDVDVEVAWPEASVPLSTPLATTMFRFVQEMLLNAVVHADGVGVRLDVRLAGADLIVTVSDRGPGFVPTAVVSADGRHVGLKLARERARLAGGVINVESAPGQGTRVTLTLPVKDGGPGAG